MVGRHHQLNGHEFEQMLSNSRVTFSLWLIHCCNTYSISGFAEAGPPASSGQVEVAGPLGTPLGLAQRKRASPRGEAGIWTGF